MWTVHPSWAWTPHITLLQGCPPHPSWAPIPVRPVTKSLFSTLLGLPHPTPHQATPQHGHCPLPACSLPPWARRALLGDGLPLPLELQLPDRAAALGGIAPFSLDSRGSIPASHALCLDTLLTRRGLWHPMPYCEPNPPWVLGHCRPPWHTHTCFAPPHPMNLGLNFSGKEEKGSEMLF